jgi:hypothetical protein
MGIRKTGNGIRKRSHLSSVFCPLHADGAIAQLGERVLCKHEVVGSIPSGSTIRRAEDGKRKTENGKRTREVGGVSWAASRYSDET